MKGRSSSFHHSFTLSVNADAMKTVAARQKTLRDARLPALPDMLGGAAIDLLNAALAPEGGALSQVRLVQANWRPGHSLTTQYSARMRTSSGEQRTVSLVALTGRNLPAGVVRLRREDAEVAVWQVPHDPALPGLAAVLDPRRAGRLARDLGAPDGDVRVRLLAYRPTRRAVVELQGATFQLFAKLVQPRHVAALQERHRIIAEQVPVPRSHGWAAELGLVVLEALPGVTLRTVLGTSDTLPAPEEIVALLAHIPDPGDRRHTAAPLREVQRHARLLKRLMPEYAGRIDELVTACGEARDGSELVPIHGDLYEAQIMVDQGRIAGVLDIDTVGLGRRCDDLATLLGHLVIWEAFSPRPRWVRAYARRVLALADQLHDAAGVRLRVAAVVFGLATNPFRVQENAWPSETLRRIGLAEAWAASATQLAGGHPMRRHEDTLTSASSAVHAATTGWQSEKR